MIFDIVTAQSQLIELIEASLAGEAVLIARDGVPVARLAPFVYRLGGLEGVIAPPPDSFFDPLSEDELREWE